MNWKDDRLEIEGVTGHQESLHLVGDKSKLLWKPNFVTWHMKSLVRRNALEDLIRVKVNSDKTVNYITG